MTARMPYDEFGLFHENAEEYGLPFDGPPEVRRVFVDVAPGRRLSALVWGRAEPELVLVHGGAQNAHTWDTVALALGRPLVAVDLPGHGHSDAGAPRDPAVLTAEANARDLAVAVRELAPSAAAVAGMSLGGLSSIGLTGVAPELVRRLVLVDVTPGIGGDKTKAILDFVRGPATFPSFDELLARTVEHNSTRSVSSLRRGILHNAVQLDDGTWQWRYRRFDDALPIGPPEGDAEPAPDSARLWDLLGAVAVPTMLVRGMRKGSVVDDADEAELLRRLPGARVEHVAQAGHSVQGDAPLELASLLEEFALRG